MHFFKKAIFALLNIFALTQAQFTPVADTNLGNVVPLSYISANTPFASPPMFLGDGNRGTESLSNYWNVAETSTPNTLNVHFLHTSFINKIVLQAPLMDVTNSYTQTNIAVSLGLDNVWTPLSQGLSITGSNTVQGCVDIVLTFPTEVRASDLQVSFNGGSNSQDILGEIMIYGRNVLQPNLALTASVSASSSYAPPFYASFINDNVRGTQGQENYWNDGTRWVYQDTVTLTFPSSTYVGQVNLLQPVMNTYGPYTIPGITVKVKTNGNWQTVAQNLQVVGGRTLTKCVDSIVSFTPVLATDVQVLFTSGNPDGWNYMGEIQVFGGTPQVELAMAWLRVTSFNMVRNSKVTMNSGMTAFPPQVGSAYNAFWLRDYSYMVEGNIQSFKFQEIKDASNLFVNSHRSDGAMVDCVMYDGTPIYMPGMGTMGSNPVADGSQFTVDVVWQSYQLTKDSSLITNSILDTLVTAMNVVPKDSTTGLVYISPIGWDRCPYGYTDAIHKQGLDFFDSLLYVQASRQLSDLLLVAGRTTDSQTWLATSYAVTQQINTVFWNDVSGYYMSATIQCNQPDIWGSAFAVRLGVANTTQSLMIATNFVNDYNGIVKRGQLRHLPSGMYWQGTTIPQGTYQNGAFWGTPVGWFVFTLDLVNPSLADSTVISMVNDYSTNGVNECINDNYVNVVNYLSSGTLPIEGIQSMIFRRSGLSVPNIPSILPLKNRGY